MDTDRIGRIEDSVPLCNNCGILEIGPFNGTGIRGKPEVRGKPLTDREWRLSLLAGDMYGGTLYNLKNLLIFSHSSSQDKSPFSPKAFARWLRSIGEAVQESRTVVNPDTKNKITGYFWAPSKKFRNKMHNFNKKIEKEEEQKENASDLDRSAD